MKPTIEKGTWQRPETPPKSVMPRERLVQRIARQAKSLSGKLQSFREKSLGDIAKLSARTLKDYGAILETNRGEVTINSWDGKYRVTVCKDDRVALNEQFAAAQSLIQECANEWSDSSENQNARIVIDRVFKPGRGGKLSISRILELLTWNIKDERWQRAMQALKDAKQKVGTATYLRVYERVGSTDKYELIKIDAYPTEAETRGQKAEVSGQEGGES